MNSLNDYRFINDENISDDEYEVIKRFLNFYKNQDVIVADELRKDYDVVPLECKEAVFKRNEEKWKIIEFCKSIFYNGKQYIVELSLWRSNKNSNNPKCLTIQEFNIISDKKVHCIDLNIYNAIKKDILFNIISIFDENKIVSPEDAYCNRMHNGKIVHDAIIANDWDTIKKGLDENPNLSNDLFIINQGSETSSHFSAYFGTILYQLLSYRMSEEEMICSKSFRELDKLILQLSRTELLKVKLHEGIFNRYYTPSDGILLKDDKLCGRVHTSKQFTVDNTELTSEDENLKKVLYYLGRK